jgi:hypothetical protein
MVERLPARPVDLSELDARAAEFARTSRGAATERAYRSDWADFTGWCDRAGVSALPADPTDEFLKTARLAMTHRDILVINRLTISEFRNKSPRRSYSARNSRLHCSAPLTTARVAPIGTPTVLSRTHRAIEIQLKNIPRGGNLILAATRDPEMSEKRRRGQPKFEPTPDQRSQVKLMKAMGIPEDRICKTITNPGPGSPWPR